MKRGSGLFAVFVALVALSIFSTGLYAGFLDTFTGNSFSLVTGRQFSIDLPKAPSIQQINLPSSKKAGEACTDNLQCLSGYCETRSGRDKKCGKSLEGESCSVSNDCYSANCQSNKCGSNHPNVARTGTYRLGMKCTQDSNCPNFPVVGRKCTKKTGETTGLCGLPAGGQCSTGNPCLSGNCEDRKCTKSPGAFLCVKENDCFGNNKCINNRCHCQKNADCAADKFCDKSGVCVGINKRINEFCKDARTCSCNQNSECEGKLERCVSYSSPICTGSQKDSAGRVCKRKLCAEPAPPEPCGELDPECNPEGVREENERLNKWRNAILNALNLFKTRLNVVERQHQSQTTGSFWSGFATREADAGAARNPEAVPETVDEWKTELRSMDTQMQSVENRICSESAKHPEIETEGLPCESGAGLGLAPSTTPTIRQGISIAPAREGGAAI